MEISKSFSLKCECTNYLFHCVDVWTDGAEALVDKTTSKSVQIKVMAQTMLEAIVLFTTTQSSKTGKENFISLKNFLHEGIKIDVIKSWFFNTCHFNILCDKIKLLMYNGFFCYTWSMSAAF